MDRPERNQKGGSPTPVRIISLCLASILLYACATVPALQENVRIHAQRGEYSSALNLLEKSKTGFGKRSRLLFLLEKGYLLHLQGDFRKSIEVFEEAKRYYEELYTRSVSGFVATLILNESAQDYRGEDFERILINVFQALNYTVLGEYDEALVEARDADARLGAINSRYPAGRKNIYREDAFCRLLMGLLYEISPLPEDKDNACISFKKSLEIYTDDYQPNYATVAPLFLKMKVCAACSYDDSITDCPKPGTQKISPTAEVYLIQYKGLSPLKEESFIPVPLPDGFISKIAFPAYRHRPGMMAACDLRAINSSGQEFAGNTECAEDIAAIAQKNLSDRSARAAAKSMLVAAGKYAVEETQQDRIYRHHGRDPAEIFGVLADLYNLSTNRADLRSWQTLPAEIRLARLELAPGEYAFKFDCRDKTGALIQSTDFGRIRLEPGKTQFFIVKSGF